MEKEVLIFSNLWNIIRNAAQNLSESGPVKRRPMKKYEQKHLTPLINKIGSQNSLFWPQKFFDFQYKINYMIYENNYIENLRKNSEELTMLQWND